MNADTAELTLIEAEPARELTTPPADRSPMGQMVTAMQKGASLADVREMMTIQREWEAGEARKAYNVAFSKFKAEAVHIVKNRQVTDGPLKGKSYAELHSVVDALTPALSRHELSASWKLTKDDKDWMEVTCYLRHSQGHEESASMGGPPDTGGAKNQIQARASTKSYLERYTLKAICGVAEGGEDNDGAGAGKAPEVPAELLAAARDASMLGWKALAQFIKDRTEAEVKLLEPESDKLKAAAKAADKAAKGAA